MGDAKDICLASPLLEKLEINHTLFLFSFVRSILFFVLCSLFSKTLNLYIKSDYELF